MIFIFCYMVFFFSFGVSKGFEGLNLMKIISHHVHIWLYILKTSVASSCQMYNEKDVL